MKSFFKRTQSGIFSAAGFVALLSLAASVRCATVYARDLPPIIGGEWRVAAEEVRDGVAYIYPGPTYVYPRNRMDDHYVFVTLSIRNLAARERVFYMSRVSLVAGDITRECVFSDMADTVAEPVRGNASPVIGGAKIKRMLVFEFPKNLRPERIVIPDVGEIPITAIRGGDN